MKTLQSTLAGTWYPGSERAIREMVTSWEAKVHKPNAGPKGPNILLLPHAGWAYAGETAWCAVRAVRGAQFRRAVVLAPSHRAWIENRLVAPESGAVATPLGEIQVDRDWLNRFALRAPVAFDDGVHRAEHAAQILYPFLQLALPGPFSIAPLVVGDLGSEQLAMAARALAAQMDGETLLVVSSDFTHYGDDFDYAPYGTSGGEDVRASVAAVDDEAFARIAAVDPDGFRAVVKRTGATICGRVPIELALRALPPGASIARMRYATSSDGGGDYSRFVCYTAAAGRADWPPPVAGALSASDRAFLLRIAREAVEQAVRTGRPFPPGHFTAEAPEAVRARMGAFVTLSERGDGSLRGCIGEIMPMRPLVEAVTARAADAALRDPRFNPVSPGELAGLRVEVSALTPPRPVESWRDIVLGRDGMTLEKDGAFAVFLPQVAPEQGWDLSTTLSYLSRKAGLPSGAWREGAKFETFQAEVFHE